LNTFINSYSLTTTKEDLVVSRGGASSSSI